MIVAYITLLLGVVHAHDHVAVSREVVSCCLRILVVTVYRILDAKGFLGKVAVNRLCMSGKPNRTVLLVRLVMVTAWIC